MFWHVYFMESQIKIIYQQGMFFHFQVFQWVPYKELIAKRAKSCLIYMYSLMKWYLFMMHCYTSLPQSASLSCCMSIRPLPGQQRKVPSVWCNVSEVHRATKTRLHQLRFFTVSWTLYTEGQREIMQSTVFSEWPKMAQRLLITVSQEQKYFYNQSHLDSDPVDEF